MWLTKGHRDQGTRVFTISSQPEASLTPVTVWALFPGLFRGVGVSPIPPSNIVWLL